MNVAFSPPVEEKEKEVVDIDNTDSLDLLGEFDA